MFDDRKDAGQKLGEALINYKGSDVLVLAIPRGGVEIGYWTAQKLNVPFSIIIVRKLPFPKNPESGFGAIAEDGSIFLVDSVRVSSDTVKKIIEEQKSELKRRIDVLRRGNTLPELTGKKVIIVDDGIAVGSTMQAAIMLCKNRKAKKIVVAAPVAGPSTAAKLAEIVDDVVILEKPHYFRAVAEAYKNWYDVSDEEVIQLLQKTDKFTFNAKAFNK